MPALDTDSEPGTVSLSSDPPATGASPTASETAAVDPPPMAWWIRALAALPWWLLYALGAFCALLLRYVLRYRVRVARTNLRQCFPDYSGRQIAALLRAHYWRLGQVAVESLKIAALSADELRARVPLVNPEVVQQELRAGRSILLVGAHHCNWEWSLHAVALQVGVPMEAAYKPLHSARADRQLRLLRTRFGARLLIAKKLLRESMRRRHRVRAVALIADQVPASSEGRHWLRFLGRETAFYPGPGEIARITGYAAFFAAMRRTGRGRYQIEFQPISAANERADPLVFTERYARLLEALIQQAPADWTWTHRRWKLAPPGTSAEAALER
jgi:Kdo2-lipid IVA lauroyltransferase/acyltransferase